MAICVSTVHAAFPLYWQRWVVAQTLKYMLSGLDIRTLLATAQEHEQVGFLIVLVLIFPYRVFSVIHGPVQYYILCSEMQADNSEPY